MPRPKAATKSVVEIRAPWVPDAQNLAEALAPLLARIERLERSVRTLTRVHRGINLIGCNGCEHYAERRVAISSPTMGTQFQNLCGACLPKHPLLGRPTVEVTETVLTQAAGARALNADLDAVYESAK